MFHLLPRTLGIPCRLAVGIVLVAGMPAIGSSQEGSAPPHAVAAPKAVVELFTSQGCSSCPPADKLLGELAKRPDVIALTLAVDYWDYLGWKDTLAKHGHSLRQKAYAKVRGDGKMFTPQTIINGRAMTVGNDDDAVQDAVTAAAAPAVPVTLSTQDGKLSVKVGAAAGQGEVWLCPLANSLTVNIGRGENEGTTMTYHNVVRRWVKLGDWSGAEATFDTSIDGLKADNVDGVAVLVQAGSKEAPGAILGAALQPLP